MNIICNINNIPNDIFDDVQTIIKSFKHQSLEAIYEIFNEQTNQHSYIILFKSEGIKRTDLVSLKFKYLLKKFYPKYLFIKSKKINKTIKEIIENIKKDNKHYIRLFQNKLNRNKLKWNVEPTALEYPSYFIDFIETHEIDMNSLTEENFESFFDNIALKMMREKIPFHHIYHHKQGIILCLMDVLEIKK